MEAESGNLSVPLAFVSVVAPALLRSQHTLGSPLEQTPGRSGGPVALHS